ncbi:hypothetical protein [Paraburkholderia bryophila]|uniref:hypothetical protein n=1 Tax=Paraburkholderia bryophila TaxID=420952 RepID=UPI0011BFA15C|nr:hypothetical protein [Paraburkholderia bryophila]
MAQKNDGGGPASETSFRQVLRFVSRRRHAGGAPYLRPASALAASLNSLRVGQCRPPQHLSAWDSEPFQGPPLLMQSDARSHSSPRLTVWLHRRRSDQKWPVDNLVQNVDNRYQNLLNSAAAAEVAHVISTLKTKGYGHNQTIF